MTDMIPDQVLGVYHRNKRQFVSVLKATVLAESQYEVIPELVDIFGDEAVKFLEIFSGRNITVPPIRDLVSKMRQVAVWIALGNAKRSNVSYEDAVASVALRLCLKKAEVRQIDKEMSGLMDHLSMELRPEDAESEDQEEAR